MRRRVWSRRQRAIIEFWTIEGLGHGVPIDRPTSAYVAVGSGAIGSEISAAEQIARFWGLH
jgi:poly(3-hydroxybutyrate) depolymerase